METTIYDHKTPVSFSTYLAIGSFIIGTILFILHQIFPNEDYIFIIGFFYVLFAILLNSLVLLNLLYQFIINEAERETIAIRMLILLANIPITLLYFFIVIKI
ncbi:hypothetical protein [Flavobacterium capsici]|uniref:Uncharacterized protein n=1 Tax=Flavobacterium capsici TaxID=3075618 RepID=A0AA96EVD5_9FLAO|nr:MULTISPECIES: hypothetical protein [unclassified Flavobacterium]WNM18547.1 hypothetical protein RN608_11060 [Flavobacterium sp. PMR2A8]WNM22598.1 hypothetical protein RN605_04360 [Flavobacterium sp. PMTSA4]